MVVQGRALGGVAGHIVVAEVAAGAAVGQRADRDDFAAVAGAGDGEVAVPAIVAGRNDDHVARIPDRFGGEDEGIGGVAFVHTFAEGQVHHTNVVAAAVGQDPVQARDHVADGAAAVVIEDFQRQHTTVFGHAFENAA